MFGLDTLQTALLIAGFICAPFVIGAVLFAFHCAIQGRL